MIKHNYRVTIGNREYYGRRNTMNNRKHMRAVLMLALCFMLTLCLAGCIQIQQPAQDQSTDTQTEQPASNDSTAAPASNDTAAPSNDANGDYIGEDKALEIGLADAGLSKDQVSNAYAHLDYDDDRGRYEYEVNFHQGTTEYDYDVDAITGEITDKDIDYNDD